MNLPLYCPLVDIYRSGCIDNRFYALMYLADKNGEIIKFKGDDNNSKFFLRSLFKPIQSSILAEDKIYNRFKFTDAELAIMQGSHSGEPLHIELIHSILNKTGLNENCLLCPPIKPLNTAIYNNDELFLSKVFNNCSGKHSMMLSYCVYKGFNIEVTTARGYEATVTVNGNKISSDSKVYSVSNEQARPGTDGNINVNVEFSKVNTYKAWVENTGLENYHGASWSSIGRSESSPQTFSAGGPYTFYVTMPYDGNDWRFNSLQINGEYVKVPTSYSKGATSEDTLSTGTAVSITLNEVPTTTYDWWGRPTTNGNYKYKITLTNVYEDIVITGGNFRANSWQEIMPNTIEGVELEVNDRQDNRGWTSVEEAVPMGYNSQGNGSYIEFRYKILPGYGNIKVNVTDGTLSSITQQNGYYKFTVTKSSAGCTVLNITATALTYSVKYTAGSGSDVSNLPTNTNSYSISGAAGTYSDIFVANEIPTAAGKIFNGWKIGENTYWPGDTVQLEDIAEYSNNNNELVFEAQWVDEGTSPDRYTYEIKVYKQNPQDPINYDLVENACETKTAQTGQPITIINRPDAAPDAGDTYEGYHLNEAKSHLTITGNDDDKEISFYYDLDQFTITTSVENGTIDESSTVYYGKDVTVNYSPKNGYELVSVIVDGEDVTDDNPNSYTAFCNV